MTTVPQPTTPGKTLRAFSYCRVSSEEQGRGYSLPTQRDSIRHYAAEHGYELTYDTHEFWDSYTGTESDRPGWTKLLNAIAAERPDVVILHDVDRLGRELFVQAIAEKELERFGAHVEYALGGYENSPEGDLLKHIKGAIAQYDNRQRVEKTVRGKRGRAQAGFVLSTGERTPYGYRYQSEPHRGYLVVDDGQAAVVRQMFHWLVEERMTSYDIAKRLWEQGTPSKGDGSQVVFKKMGRNRWDPATVRGILANPTYKGEWYYGKRKRVKIDGKTKQVPTPPETWTKVAVPAIVAAEVWAEAQECLRANRQKASRNTRREYLLASLIFCTCGKRWTGLTKVRSGVGYYKCAAAHSEKWLATCDNKFHLRQANLEAAVLSYVKDCLLQPDTLSEEINRQRESHAAMSAEREQRIRAIEAALADTDRRLGELLTKELDGYPKAIIETQKRSLLEKRRDLETENNRVQTDRQAQEITPELTDAVQELADVVQEGWDRLTFEERRRILELLRLRVDVIDRGHVRVSGLITASIKEVSSE